MVKIGTTQAQRRLFFALARTRRELARAGEDADLDDRVARHLRVRPEEVREASRRMECRDQSLDVPGLDGGPSTLERLPPATNPRTNGSAGSASRPASSRGVQDALALLDERERTIVEQRFMSDDPASLQDLGDRFGFSRERARQLEIRARGKLRAALGQLAAA